MNTLLIIEALRQPDKGIKKNQKLPAPPTIDQRATGQRIKYYMDRANLKPADIQWYLGLTCVQTVYRWLDGTNIPTIDHLYALSRLLGVRVDDMIIAVKKEKSVQDTGNKSLGWLVAYCQSWKVRREAN